MLLAMGLGIFLVPLTLLRGKAPADTVANASNPSATELGMVLSILLSVPLLSKFISFLTKFAASLRHLRT